MNIAIFSHKNSMQIAINPDTIYEAVETNEVEMRELNPIRKEGVIVGNAIVMRVKNRDIALTYVMNNFVKLFAILEKEINYN